MAFITVGQEKPVVLIHGYPLNHSWEKQESVAGSGNVAVGSAPVAAYAVVPSWIEDFRGDVDAVREFGKPTLILHRTKDNILPIDATGRRFHKSVPEADYVEIEGAPHGLLWTHADEVSAALAAFLRK